MKTRLQVANTSLAMLGIQSLTSWGEATPAGTLASIHLPVALQQTLRETQWPSLVHFVGLTDSDRTDRVLQSIGMLYAYVLPPDMFHLVEVNGKKNGWRIVEDVLHTNEPNPDILYLTEPSDDSIPDDVAHVTAYLLAHYIGQTLIQDDKRVQMLLSYYSVQLNNEKGRIEQQAGYEDTSSGWWTD